MDLLIISDWGSIEITIGHLASLAIVPQEKIFGVVDVFSGKVAKCPYL